MFLWHQAYRNHELVLWWWQLRTLSTFYNQTFSERSLQEKKDVSQFCNLTGWSDLQYCTENIKKCICKTDGGKHSPSFDEIPTLLLWSQKFPQLFKLSIQCLLICHVHYFPFTGFASLKGLANKGILDTIDLMAISNPSISPACRETGFSSQLENMF